MADTSDSSGEEGCDTSDTDEDFTKPNIKKQKNNNTDFTNVLETAGRFWLSNTATAHLIISASTSCGLISEVDQTNVMYRKKVERMRKDIWEER